MIYFKHLYKCLRLNSLTSFIHTCGIDCFRYNWTSTSRLSLNVINHLRECKGIGYVVNTGLENAEIYAFMKLHFRVSDIKYFY